MVYNYKIVCIRHNNKDTKTCKTLALFIRKQLKLVCVNDGKAIDIIRLKEN